MSDELIIRQAIPEDTKELISFYKKIQNYKYIDAEPMVISAKEMEKSIATIYDSLTNNLIIAINDDAIIGFCRIDYGELGIVVDSNFWRFGVATELMIDSIEWFNKISNLEELWLEVYIENIAARSLYKKFNFIEYSRNDKTIKMKLKKDD